METLEMRTKIKDYFVEIKEDKFTKVKTIKCKHNITWKGNDLENKFMLTKNSDSNKLKMSIDYRHVGEVDSVFFTFIYENCDGGYPGMTNIKMYLILDDDKNIELSKGSGFDHKSQTIEDGDDYINVYLETAQLSVGMSDFIAIANAKKIEYSIRFGQGSLENQFKKEDLMIFKGFYSTAFDNEFDCEELEQIHQALGNLKESLKVKYELSESDIIRLKEIEIEKSNLGVFSFKKEKLKIECMSILKPYNVKFMDLGILLEEIKKS